MRLPKLIILLCLLFSACVGSNSVVATSKTFFVSKYLFEGAKKKTVLNGVVVTTKCNPKRHQLGHYLSCSDQKKNTNSDDKRVVPTGPNPLHNR